MPTQLDSRVRIVTPENISFEYRVAGPFARVGAYLLDLLFILISYCFVAMVMMFVGVALDIWGFGAFAIQVFFFLSFWFYGGFFEWAWNGQTPGKRMTGLRVLRTDGRPITSGQAVLRNLLRFVDLFPFISLYSLFEAEVPFGFPTCLIGLTAMACSQRHQRVGDLACSTMVIAEEPSGSGRAAKDWTDANATARDPQLQRVLASLPASFRPSRTLAKALSHYASRRRYLGPARRREIAKHVGAPLVETLHLPADTDHDLLLCALYVRAFLTESEESEARPADVPSLEPQVEPAPLEPAPPEPMATAPPPTPTSVGVPGSASYRPATPTTPDYPA